ncbi:hypothetical protein SALIVB_2099 [Streptococcus salivarius CCHSS3]|nr:hypothetical protein SALIVB_2099 [Streptococcus salivarius CCHSS3]
MQEFNRNKRDWDDSKKEELRNEAPLAFYCPNQYSYFK